MLGIDEINKLKSDNKQLKNDYEVLDACCELQSMKIKALKEENAQLQAYKDINEDFKKAWEELKAENEKLREDYIKQSQQKDLDNVRWQKRCTDLHIEDKAKADKYWLVLQEIKAIAERQLLVTNVRTYQMVYYADFSEYRNEILEKITKAEEE